MNFFFFQNPDADVHLLSNFVSDISAVFPSTGYNALGTV